MGSQEGDFLADLECGGTTSEDEGSKDAVPGTNQGRKSLSRGRSGVLNYNGSISSDSDDNDSNDSLTKSSVPCQRVEVLIERSPGGEESRDLVALLDKRSPNDQRKKPSLKKAAKPPRPPKGPLLNATDLKLVKELSELAARKRARIERMKALRKMKDAKRPSSSSNVTAMVITVLFFLIIIFQGVFTRNNTSRESQGSPAPAVASESLISVQLFNNAPTYEMKGPAVSMSLNSLERASSSSPRQEEGRDIG